MYNASKYKETAEWSGIDPNCAGFMLQKLALHVLMCSLSSMLSDGSLLNLGCCVMIRLPGWSNVCPLVSPLSLGFTMLPGVIVSTFTCCVCFEPNLGFSFWQQNGRETDMQCDKLTCAMTMTCNLHQPSRSGPFSVTAMPLSRLSALRGLSGYLAMHSSRMQQSSNDTKLTAKTMFS